MLPVPTMCRRSPMYLRLADTISNRKRSFVALRIELQLHAFYGKQEFGYITFQILSTVESSDCVKAGSLQKNYLSSFPSSSILTISGYIYIYIEQTRKIKYIELREMVKNELFFKLRFNIQIGARFVRFLFKKKRE